MERPPNHDEGAPPMPRPDKPASRYTPNAANLAKVQSWFKYHPPKGDQPDRYSEINERCAALADYLLHNTPNSAEQTLAIRSLQECRMWANASIALNEDAP